MPATVPDSPLVSARLCVLATSSGGNCSVLRVEPCATRDGKARHFLLDAGLSKKRTRLALEGLGVALEDLEGVLVTHLDADHWQPCWARALREKAFVHLHVKHRARADREGFLYTRTNVFEDEFELCPGVRVSHTMNPHDDLGSVAYRIDFEATGASLGFATDMGLATRHLLALMRGVDVLAIESNYCPTMQLLSSRTEQTKERIMGGAGHLSNQQSAAAVGAIAPTSHVVLLHLSRECNTPEIALSHHQDHGVPVTVGTHDALTGWIDVALGETPHAERAIVTKPQDRRHARTHEPATLWG